jgi:predicted nucleotidyltransferase
MNRRFGLTETTIQKINGIFTRYPQVEKTVLYGSRAKGNFKNGSDIDLTLFGDKNLTSDVLYHIKSDMDDLPIPYKVDLSIFRHMSDPDVIDHIRRIGVVFYETMAQTNHF